MPHTEELSFPTFRLGVGQLDGGPLAVGLLLVDEDDIRWVGAGGTVSGGRGGRTSPQVDVTPVRNHRFGSRNRRLYYNISTIYIRVGRIKQYSMIIHRQQARKHLFITKQLVCLQIPNSLIVRRYKVFIERIFLYHISTLHGQLSSECLRYLNKTIETASRLAGTVWDKEGGRLQSNNTTW